MDHVDCLRAWAESLGGISYPLLSDFWPHGEAAERYSVFRGRDGYSERAIFVLDRNGVIRYIDVHDISNQPDNEEVRNVLRQIELEYTGQKGAPPAALPTAGDVDPADPPSGGIVLYCARWCKDCKKARSWLEARGLEYSEFDIDYDLPARMRVRQWGNGQIITPVIDFNGAVVVDYDEEKMEQALRQSGIS